MMKYSFLIAATACLGICASAWAEQPKVVAHRGHWTAPGAAQNSIASLVKADSIGCYASEFDVWLTADSVLVVNHDATTPSGVKIETAQSGDVLADRLSNGEPLPTLRSYLEAAARLPRLRLVLELKEHNDRAHEREAARRAVAMVEELGLAPRTDYITFSSDAFKEFIKLAPNAQVYYLTSEYIPEQIAHMRGAGPDYHFSAFKKHPDWIERSHALGQKVNAWTVNKPEDMQWCIDHGVDFITTNDPELLLKMLQ